MRFEVLSNPFEGDFLTVASNISEQLSRKVDARVRVLADQAGLRLPRVLDAEGGCGVSWWRPEVGAVISGLHSTVRSEDASWVAGQWLVAAFMNGALPSVDVVVTGDHPLVVAGHAISAQSLRVCGVRNQLDVHAADGALLLRVSRATTDAAAPAWVASANALVRVGAGSVAVVSDGAWMDHWFPAESRFNAKDTEPSAALRTLEEAVDLLETHCPEMYLWVALALREIVFLKESSPGKLASQSFMRWFGEVQLSSANAIDAIVSLAHECSHQYFNMLLIARPLVVEGAPDDYSAIKKRTRPLEKILLGYHAFGNILLTLQRFRGRDTGLPAADLDDRIAEVEPMVAQLGAVLLARHADLAPAGQSLFAPLDRRVSGGSTSRHAAMHLESSSHA